MIIEPVLIRPAVLALLGVRSSALVAQSFSQPMVSYDFVDTPEPDSFSDMKFMGDYIDMGKFVVTHTKSPRDSDKNLTIMAYPWREDKGVSGNLNQGLGWETAHTKEICTLWQREGMKGNFLDVGANIGTYTVPLADCAHGLNKIISIEGMPDIADHLRASIVANGQSNVVLYPYAVGDDSTQNSITMVLNPENKGGSTVKGNKAWTSDGLDALAQRFKKKVNIKEFTVPLTTANAMLKGNPSLQKLFLAKIDIEGNEGRFLKGASELFSQYPPCYVVIELIPEWLDRANTPVEGILAQLSQWGYVQVPTMDDVRYRKRKTFTIRYGDEAKHAKCLDRISS